MRLTKQSESQPPTLSELRNSLAQIHTAPLRMVHAKRYERDLGAALRIVDRLIAELAPLLHCPPNIQGLRCNKMTCRECWERWLDAMMIQGGE
jgi:hypothetical protein